MVFSSVPVYLDPPNWHQRPNHEAVGVDGTQNNPQLRPPLQPPPPVGGGGGGTVASIRPCSMADRARLAKLPQPETAVKCPRCESTNTKFCYFNNYSLSQPRHFCKTCRRYWTRGGALRNVPVGGGCRRNKRSKGIRSKSPVTAGRQVGGSACANSCTIDVVTHLPPPPPQLPFLPSLADYGAGDIGMNFAGIQTPAAVSGGADIEFQMGSGTGGGGALLSARLAEQWRLQQAQQFPFFSGLEPPSSGIYQFEAEGGEPSCYAGQPAGQLGSKALDSGVTQVAAVKMEENQGLNMSRNFLGITGSDQYWGSNAWTDLCGAFTSSSTSHLL